MSKQSEAKNLAGRIYTLIVDGRILSSNWGFYLRSKEFEKESELRNKIGAIWISALLDSLDAEYRVLDKYEKEAKDKGYKNMVIWCQTAHQFYDCIKEVLSLYSKQEQLFIQDFRDQLVHGWLFKKHNQEFNIKYYNGVKLVTERISHEEYHDTVRGFFCSGVDSTMKRLIDKFVDDNLDYWKILNILNSPGFLDKVATAIYSDIGEEYRRTLTKC